MAAPLRAGHMWGLMMTGCRKERAELQGLASGLLRRCSSVVVELEVMTCGP